MSLTLDKTKRYDRQLRLWGEHGQTSLENARVCLIGSNGVGTEILKNLILPGVGKITIVDDALITVEDLSNNFFICDSDINQSRAETTARLLRELNEEVMVSHIDDSVESLLAYNPDFFLNFSIVIACGLNNKDLVGLDRLLYPENIALVVCYSLGMVASLRIIIREHSVFDTRPDNVLADLRLDKPLSQFSAFCNSQDLNNMSHKDIAHCPWIVILYKYLQIFQQQHCRWPESYKDKCILKDLIEEGGYYYQKLTQTGDGGTNNDYFDSFEEAKKAVSTAVTKTEIPANILSILNDPRSVNINKESRPFWVLVSAVRDFVSNEGQGMLPLRGDIPDMTADSDRYISIQRMYRNEADRNAAIVEAYVQRLCQTFEICVSAGLVIAVSRLTVFVGDR